jgi:hypothetical protein
MPFRRVFKGGGRTGDTLSYRLAALAMTATGAAAKGGGGTHNPGAHGASGSDGDSAMLSFEMILMYALVALAILLVTLYCCRRYQQRGINIEVRARGCAGCRPAKVKVDETGADILTASERREVADIDNYEGPSSNAGW